MSSEISGNDNVYLKMGARKISITLNFAVRGGDLGIYTLRNPLRNNES